MAAATATPGGSPALSAEVKALFQAQEKGLKTELLKLKQELLDSVGGAVDPKFLKNNSGGMQKVIGKNINTAILSNLNVLRRDLSGVSTMLKKQALIYKELNKKLPKLDDTILKEMDIDEKERKKKEKLDAIKNSQKEKVEKFLEHKRITDEKRKERLKEIKEKNEKVRNKFAENSLLKTIKGYFGKLFGMFGKAKDKIMGFDAKAATSWLMDLLRKAFFISLMVFVFTPILKKFYDQYIEPLLQKMYDQYIAPLYDKYFKKPFEMVIETVKKTYEAFMIFSKDFYNDFKKFWPALVKDFNYYVVEMIPILFQDLKQMWNTSEKLREATWEYLKLLPNNIYQHVKVEFVALWNTLTDPKFWKHILVMWIQDFALIFDFLWKNFGEIVKFIGSVLARVYENIGFIGIIKAAIGASIYFALFGKTGLLKLLISPIKSLFGFFLGAKSWIGQMLGKSIGMIETIAIFLKDSILAPLKFLASKFGFVASAVKTGAITAGKALLGGAGKKLSGVALQSKIAAAATKRAVVGVGANVVPGAGQLVSAASWTMLAGDIGSILIDSTLGDDDERREGRKKEAYDKYAPIIAEVLGNEKLNPIQKKRALSRLLEEVHSAAMLNKDSIETDAVPFIAKSLSTVDSIIEDFKAKKIIFSEDLTPEEMASNFEKKGFGALPVISNEVPDLDKITADTEVTQQDFLRMAGIQDENQANKKIVEMSKMAEEKQKKSNYVLEAQQKEAKEIKSVWATHREAALKDSAFQKSENEVAIADLVLGLEKGRWNKQNQKFNEDLEEIKAHQAELSKPGNAFDLTRQNIDKAVEISQATLNAIDKKYGVSEKLDKTLEYLKNLDVKWETFQKNQADKKDLEAIHEKLGHIGSIQVASTDILAQGIHRSTSNTMAAIMSSASQEDQDNRFKDPNRRYSLSY